MMTVIECTDTERAAILAARHALAGVARRDGVSGAVAVYCLQAVEQLEAIVPPAESDEPVEADPGAAIRTALRQLGTLPRGTFARPEVLAAVDAAQAALVAASRR